MKIVRLGYLSFIIIVILGLLDGKEMAEAQESATMSERRSGDVRRLRLYSPVTGQNLNIIYWIDGQYIEEGLIETAHFLSQISNTKPIIDTHFFDILSATSNLLRIQGPTSFLYYSYNPYSETDRVHLSISQRNRMQFCRAWASIEGAGYLEYCANDRGSRNNPIALETEVARYEILYTEGLLSLTPEELAGLEQGSQPSGPGMAMTFVQHALPNERPDRLGTPQPDLPCTHRLTGQIMQGDGARISTTLAEVASRFEQARQEHKDVGGMFLCLDSPGGTLVDALQIADIVLQHGIPTYVEENATCESACFWIFMAGNHRLDNKPWRVLAPGARLGFHTGFLPSDDHLDFSSIQLENVVQLGMQAIAEINAVFGQLGTFSDGTPVLPASLLRQMASTPSDQMYLIETIDDAGRWNIWVDFPFAHSLTESDFIRACQNKISWEKDRSGHTAPDGLMVRRDTHRSGGVSLHIVRSERSNPLCTFPVSVETINNREVLRERSRQLSPILFLHPDTRIDASLKEPVLSFEIRTCEGIDPSNNLQACRPRAKPTRVSIPDAERALSFTIQSCLDMFRQFPFFECRPRERSFPEDQDRIDTIAKLLSEKGTKPEVVRWFRSMAEGQLKDAN